MNDNTNHNPARLAELEAWRQNVVEAAEKLLAADDNIEPEHIWGTRVTGYICRACEYAWQYVHQEVHAPDCPRKVLESLIREGKEEAQP